jgi:serine O-acetyltransferase
VPARVVGAAGCAEPARSMDQLVAMSEFIDIAGGI